MLGDASQPKARLIAGGRSGPMCEMFLENGNVVVSRGCRCLGCTDQLSRIPSREQMSFRCPTVLWL